MNLHIPKEGDILWHRFVHANGSQWIRVQVMYVDLRNQVVAVQAVIPGDVPNSRTDRPLTWGVRLDDVQADEPSFDQIDATYDGEGDLEFA